MNIANFSWNAKKDVSGSRQQMSHMNSAKLY